MLPIHAAHAKAGHLLNGTTSSLGVAEPFLCVDSGVLLGGEVCVYGPASLRPAPRPPAPPGQLCARLRRNTGEGKAGFLLFRSLQTCYGTQRNSTRQREMPNWLRQQTLSKDKHLKQVLTQKHVFQTRKV